MFCNSRKFDFKDDTSSDSTIREINDTERVYSCFTRRQKWHETTARAGVGQETESDEDESS